MNKKYQKTRSPSEERRIMRIARRRRRRYSLLLTLIILLILLIIIGTTTLIVTLTMHTYVLTDGDRYESVRLHPGSVEEAIEKTGFKGLEVLAAREGHKTTYLTLGQKLSAQITTKDQSFSVSFTACTVEELLEQNGIEVGENDIVTPDLDKMLIENTDISVVSVRHRTETEKKPIPFEVEMRDTAELEEGQQRIAQYGKNGELTITYRITLHDGTEAEKETVSEEQTTKPVNCIVEQGVRKPKPAAEHKPKPKPDPPTPVTPPPPSISDSTSGEALSTAGRSEVWSVPAGITDDKANKTITAGDGSSFTYSAVIDVKATAYHRIEDGGLITASGTTTKYGTVAVDPRIIPLGSRVYVVSDGGDQSWSYGPGLAEDTGGLIKGNRIDLFFMTGDEADQFGVRPAKVYILK